MKPVVTRAQMRALDADAIEAVGIPSLTLMEVAGRAVAEAAEALAYAEGSGRVIAVAGTGNNGADAVVAARHLRERGLEVELVVLGAEDALTPDARHQLEVAQRLGLSALILEEKAAVAAVEASLREPGVVIDGLFGVGLSRAIEGWRRAAVERIEVHPHPVVAVDIPSGVDADTGAVLGEAVTADVTVTFQYAKAGLLFYPGRSRAGELRVVDIGIPPSRLPKLAPEAGPVAGWLEEDTLQEALPPRAGDAHKGTFGHLLVVAGAPDRPGSALLAARAAARAGAGLVTLGSDAETIRRLAPTLVEIMGLTVGEGRPDAQAVRAALPGRTAVALGPSLAPDAETASFLRAVLEDQVVPAVLDAGALSALGPMGGWIRNRKGPTVITPHPGEAGRMLGLDSAGVQSDRIASARRLADQTGAIAVLKGATTVIAEPNGLVALSTRGNPGLATGGTGDVLVGVIGALLAQGVEPGLAARAGVELHGLAGDRAAEQLGERAVVASDVVRALAGPIDGIDGLGAEP
ncbi:MAG: NAD(P)H-hydrate dehydratase [Myxococcota bacterium]